MREMGTGMQASEDYLGMVYRILHAVERDQLLLKHEPGECGNESGVRGRGGL